MKNEREVFSNFIKCHFHEKSIRLKEKNTQNAMIYLSPPSVQAIWLYRSHPPKNSKLSSAFVITGVLTISGTNKICSCGFSNSIRHR